MPYTFDDKTAKAVGKEDDRAPGGLETPLLVNVQAMYQESWLPAHWLLSLLSNSWDG